MYVKLFSSETRVHLISCLLQYLNLMGEVEGRIKLFIGRSNIHALCRGSNGSLHARQYQRTDERGFESELRQRGLETV